MAWNNGFERKRFEKEQEKLAAEYRAVGMTEEQIEQMYQFDLAEFNSTRRFFEHNQQIPNNIFGTDDEGLCPLNGKFLEAMSVTNEQSDVKSRYWWIDEIEDPQLAKELKELPAEDIEIITLYTFENYTQSEIAKVLGLNQSTICRRLEAKKKFLERFLKHA